MHHEYRKGKSAGVIVRFPLIAPRSRRRLFGLGLEALGAALWLRGAGSSVNAAIAINDATDVDDLLEQIHSLLNSLKAPQLASFMNEWPRTGQRRATVPASLDVLRWMSRVKANAPDFSSTLVRTLSRATPLLNWRQTYKQPAVGATFLANYGYTEIVGLAGPLPSSRLACGFLLLGPMTTYPPHHHEAEEIYVPLSGTASWLHGDQHWREELPGAVIHHMSNESHAMRTAAEPLLALYLWRSNNLNQKSSLDAS